MMGLDAGRELVIRRMECGVIHSMVSHSNHKGFSYQQRLLLFKKKE